MRVNKRIFPYSSHILLVFSLFTLIFILSGCAGGNHQISCTQQSGFLCNYSKEFCGGGLANAFQSSNNSAILLCCTNPCVSYSGNLGLSCGQQNGFLCDYTRESCSGGSANKLSSLNNTDRFVCCKNACVAGSGNPF